MIIIHFSFRFGPSLYTCACDNRDEVEAVTLVRKSCDQPNHILPVTSPKTVRKAAISVCVAPLHGYYTVPDEVIDMIETNRFFGAERFMFYNLASRRNTLNLLKYYQNRDVVDIVNFTLPINSKTNKTINIHYHGQLVSLLDCVYRNIYKSNFVTHLDVDEVIMPHHAELNSLSKIANYFIGKNNKTCSCIFHVAFYSSKRTVPSPLNLAEIGRHVMFLNRTLREGDIWDIPRRSKSIVDASKVIMPGIHFVRRCEGTKSDAVEVAPSIGILHHYRDANARYANRNKRVEDTFSRKFISDVTERINAVIWQWQFYDKKGTWRGWIWWLFRDK